MNLQFWYVPRDNQILYLRAIAHDSSNFFRKVEATINCDVSSVTDIIIDTDFTNFNGGSNVYLKDNETFDWLLNF